MPWLMSLDDVEAICEEIERALNPVVTRLLSQLCDTSFALTENVTIFGPRTSTRLSLLIYGLLTLAILLVLLVLFLVKGAFDAHRKVRIQHS